MMCFVITLCCVVLLIVWFSYVLLRTPYYSCVHFRFLWLCWFYYCGRCCRCHVSLLYYVSCVIIIIVVAFILNGIRCIVCCLSFLTKLGLVFVDDQFGYLCFDVCSHLLYYIICCVCYYQCPPYCTFCLFCKLSRVAIIMMFVSLIIPMCAPSHLCCFCQCVPFICIVIIVFVCLCCLSSSYVFSYYESCAYCMYMYVFGCVVVVSSRSLLLVSLSLFGLVVICVVCVFNCDFHYSDQLSYMCYVLDLCSQGCYDYCFTYQCVCVLLLSWRVVVVLFIVLSITITICNLLFVVMSRCVCVCCFFSFSY